MGARVAALARAVCLAASIVSLGSATSRELADSRPLDQAGFPAALYARLTPPDNLPTPAKVALGRALFFEARMSRDNSTACRTCHDPAKGFTDNRVTSIGIGAAIGHRNAPTILNAAFNSLQFLDGRAPSLEFQALKPILNPAEMGAASGDDVVRKLIDIPRYRDQFAAVFGHPMTYADIGAAIAAYERTLVSFGTPFDRYIAGDASALSDSARRGWAVYNGRGRCIYCHQYTVGSPLFTDNQFHNIGVAARSPDFAPLAKRALEALRSDGGAAAIDRMAIGSDLSALGRFMVTRDARDIGAFRTPDIRNLLVTQPYFHDGSSATLWDIVDLYDRGGERNPYLDQQMVPLSLTSDEKDDLVAFMASLTSPEYADAAARELARQTRIHVAGVKK